MKRKLSKKVSPYYAMGSLLFFVAFVLWIVLYVAYSEEVLEKEPDALGVKFSQTASLILDYGEKRRKFEGETIPGMTVYDALVQSSKAGGFSLETFMEDGRLKIKAIDGIEIQKNGNTWHLYINEEYKNMSSPLDYVLKEGDDVEFIYE